MVLLHNVPATSDATVLPLQLDGVRRVAIIGPNSALGEIMGGGSAHVTPTAVSTPLEALTAFFAAAGIEVDHRPGCQIHRRLPEVDLRRCSDVVVDIYDDPAKLDDAAATPVSSGSTGTVRLMWVVRSHRQGRRRPVVRRAHLHHLQPRRHR